MMTNWCSAAVARRAEHDAAEAARNAELMLSDSLLVYIYGTICPRQASSSYSDGGGQRRRNRRGQAASAAVAAAAAAAVEPARALGDHSPFIGPIFLSRRRRRRSTLCSKQCCSESNVLCRCAAILQLNKNLTDTRRLALASSEAQQQKEARQVELVRANLAQKRGHAHRHELGALDQALRTSVTEEERDFANQLKAALHASSLVGANPPPRRVSKALAEGGRGVTGVIIVVVVVFAGVVVVIDVFVFAIVDVVVAVVDVTVVVHRQRTPRELCR
jgi:hypothetical protein